MQLYNDLIKEQGVANLLSFFKLNNISQMWANAYFIYPFFLFINFFPLYIHSSDLQ